MEFTTTKAQIDEPLKMAASVVTKSPAHPVLSHVLMQADDNGVVRLTGTDNSSEVVTQMGVQTRNPGSLTVPAHKLRDICASMKDDDAEIKFSVNGQQLSVSSGNSKFKIHTLPADHFPNIEHDYIKLAREVSQRDLKALLDGIMPAMASKDVRYYLNGICLNIKGTILEGVATDGHRLNVDQIEVGAPSAATNNDSEALQDASVGEADGQVLIPRDFVMNLNRMLSNYDEPVALVVSHNHFQIRRGDTVYTSKLIEGNYPDYNRIMPASNDTPVIADTQSLKAALERIKVISDGMFHGASVSIETNSMQLDSHNADQEQVSEPVSVDYQGDAIKLGFNAAYLIDALKACGSEQVQIHIKDEKSSALIIPHGKESAIRCVVMPMRL